MDGGVQEVMESTLGPAIEQYHFPKRILVGGVALPPPRHSIKAGSGCARVFMYCAPTPYFLVHPAIHCGCWRPLRVQCIPGC